MALEHFTVAQRVLLSAHVVSLLVVMLICCTALLGDRLTSRDISAIALSGLLVSQLGHQVVVLIEGPEFSTGSLRCMRR